MNEEERNDENRVEEESQEENKESRFTKENRKKKVEYRMDGTAITVEGKLTKTKYFEFLEVPLDDYSDLKFSPQEIARIRNHIMNMRTGLQAMAPMFCGGPKLCPVIFRCPFRQQTELDKEKMDPKKFPIGRQCIIEREFLLHKRREYFEEYDVDPNSPTEIGLINKLAELDMYEYRATLMLAHGDSGLGGQGQDLLKEQTTAVTPQGRELKRVELHPAWDLKEKIHKQRMEILSSLVGTRKEKYKKQAATKTLEVRDPSTKQSQLKNKLEKMIEASNQEEVIDAEHEEVKVEES
jgi:hypothetical protein